MRRARHLTAVLAILAVPLVAAGCGGDEEEAGTADQPAVTTEPDTTTEPLAAGQSCTSEEGGYAVRYPEGWSTNEGGPIPACRFFHPEPFTLEEGTEATGLAITVNAPAVELEQLLEQMENGTVLRREEIRVGGRDAVVLETESSGRGLFPEGTRVYQYLVDLGDQTLVASTVETGDLDYERNKGVLDELVQTVEPVS